MIYTKSFKFKQLFQLVALVTLLTACTATSVQDPPLVPPIPVDNNGQRVALIIGNSEYPGDFLPNPINDAKDFAKVLGGYGFTVIHKSDLNKQQMDEAIIDFGQRLGKNGVGLFFFAGHGIQIDQHNYLIPIGPKIEMASLVKYRAIEAQQVVDIMNEAGSRVNIVILDACRDNPYRSYFRSPDGLAATMNAPDETLISYSTAPGKKSADGDGRNGLFTEHLLKAIKQSPGSTIEEVLKQTARNVAKKSGNRQVPWRLSSLTRDFCFANCAKTTAAGLPEQVPQPGNVFQDRLKDGSLGPKMVMIPAGRFRMGDIQGGGGRDEQPVHSVSVNQFAMGLYEVTFAEYDKFADATSRSKPDDEGWGRGNRPVINVSWHDATAYMKWLSEQTGKQYRLPTEAQWEYAARAGTTTKYWWGNDIGTNRANCYGSRCGDSFKYTAPVGSFAKNPYGLYDTIGNVWEWTCSEYQNKYAGNEQRCVNGGSRWMLRGGAWNLKPRYVRAANRSRYSDGPRSGNVGFRLVRLP